MMLLMQPSSLAHAWIPQQRLSRLLQLKVQLGQQNLELPLLLQTSSRSATAGDPLLVQLVQMKLRRPTKTDCASAFEYPYPFIL